MSINIFDDEYTPRFTGHETFHLRYGWLKKAYDAVNLSDSGDIAENIFRDKSAISHFGVGKNMVAAIRHWAMSFGIIRSAKDKPTLSEHETTALGDYIFDNKNGVDPYLESLETLWLLHWRLVTQSNKTTFLYAFNAFNEAEIDREKFLRTLRQLITSRGWGNVADATLQKDISNLIGTYAVRRIDKRVSVEDVISSPLTELQLLSQAEGNSFKFNRGGKVGLSDGVFAFCLLEFWNMYSEGTTTLSFEAVCHEPFSPGRAFFLSAQDLMQYISRLEDITSGAVRWVESSGSRHISRSDNQLQASFEWLSADSKSDLRTLAA